MLFSQIVIVCFRYIIQKLTLANNNNKKNQIFALFPNFNVWSEEITI